MRLNRDIGNQLNTPSLTGHGVEFTRRLACAYPIFPGGFTSLALWVRRFVRSWSCRKATISATIIANCRFMYCMIRQSGRLLAVLFGEIDEKTIDPSV